MTMTPGVEIDESRNSVGPGPSRIAACVLLLVLVGSLAACRETASTGPKDKVLGRLPNQTALDFVAALKAHDASVLAALSRGSSREFFLGLQEWAGWQRKVVSTLRELLPDEANDRRLVRMETEHQPLFGSLRDVELQGRLDEGDAGTHSRLYLVQIEDRNFIERTVDLEVSRDETGWFVSRFGELVPPEEGLLGFVRGRIAQLEYGVDKSLDFVRGRRPRHLDMALRLYQEHRQALTQSASPPRDDSGSGEPGAPR
ncbi:MAG: hypothetical protein KDB18_13450 [Salinibacterium sp.]|nr:hypothetical protein [Salinibacterium sp.]